MTRRDFQHEVERFMDVYNEAWGDNWGFVPITDAEVAEFIQLNQARIRPGTADLSARVRRQLEKVAAQVENITTGKVRLPWDLAGEPPDAPNTQADFFFLFVVTSCAAGILIRGADDIVAWLTAATAFLALGHTFRKGELVRMDNRDGQVHLERAEVLSQPVTNLHARLEVEQATPEMLRIHDVRAELFGVG